MPRSTRTRGRNTRYDSTEPASTSRESTAAVQPAKKRRGNLPKESVALMKKWLKRNASNPYPSEDEKKSLATIGKISIVQVSNWFINARRRVLPEVLQASGIDVSKVTISRRNRQQRPRPAAAAAAASVAPVASTSAAPPAEMAAPPIVDTAPIQYAASTGQCSPASASDDDHDYCTPPTPKPPAPTADQMHNFDTLLHVALGELHAIRGSLIVPPPPPPAPELIIEEAPTVEIVEAAIGPMHHMQCSVFA